MSDIKHIPIKEFREIGYLQEVNRQFFHPLGLALEIVIEDCHHPGVEAGSFPADRCQGCDEDGKIHRLGGVWDYRSDPEGIVFAGDIDIDAAKIATVHAELQKHRPAREALLEPGRFIQRPGDNVDLSEPS